MDPTYDLKKQQTEGATAVRLCDRALDILEWVQGEDRTLRSYLHSLKGRGHYLGSEFRQAFRGSTWLTRPSRQPKAKGPGKRGPRRTPSPTCATPKRSCFAPTRGSSPGAAERYVTNRGRAERLRASSHPS